MRAPQKSENPAATGYDAKHNALVVDSTRTTQPWKVPYKRDYSSSAMEANYRRGFSQAVWFAAQAANAGATPSEMHKWALEVLAWRAARLNAEFVCPPMIGGEK